jgi:NAD(P)-dependent dehydrogenase (short-subunit alcohol dehydrogenase family)
MPLAVITGASRGLGAALATALDQRGWDLVVDARHPDALRATPGHRVAGDVTDPAHRQDLADTAARLGGADLLVNNASTLGSSPMPAVADLGTDVLSRTLATNVVAPHALTRLLLPQLLAHRGTVLNLTSDASVEAYEGWAAYGSSKAALDHLTRILAAEQPSLRVYLVDPGDMRTRMHQDAFPGEDISDRPDPATVVPHLLALVTGDLPSGRYRAADVAVRAGV